ncbi:amino acid permease 3-like [Hordeum vulgare]|nr:amino acid permease 3-like [Hordeum vulgare]
MTLFAVVIYYTSALLADCYRASDPVSGPHNLTYMAVVGSTLCGSMVKLCGAVQFINLVGFGIGITIAATGSMLAIKEADFFHKEGHKAHCSSSSVIPYIAIYGIMEICFSQIPGLDSLWWLSTVTTVMSLTYTTIGISLGVVQIKANGGLHGSLTGVAVGNNNTVMQKVWHGLEAFGNMAFTYAFSIVLLEIQDTLKAAAPSKAKVMKKATTVNVAVTTVIYLLCGCMGYVPFGDGFRIYEPLWLLDVANAVVAVHLVGTYQVISQPIFDYVELHVAAAWPDTGFVSTRDVRLWPTDVHVAVCPLRLIGRTMPDHRRGHGHALLRRHVPRGSTRWLLLQALSTVCLLVSLAAAAGSIAVVAAEIRQR